MFALAPSTIDTTAGVIVLPLPWFLVSYVSLKTATSPTARVPAVIVGVAAAFVVPSYVFVFAAPVIVNARAVIVPLLLVTNAYV